MVVRARGGVSRGEPRGRRGSLPPTWPGGRARSPLLCPGRAGRGLAAGELVSGAASLPLAGRSNTLPAGHRKQTVTWAGGRGRRAEGTPIPPPGCRGVPPGECLGSGAPPSWGLSGLPESARLVSARRPRSASVPGRHSLFPAAPTGARCGVRRGQSGPCPQRASPA